jgi:hypothetical protein
MKRWRAILIIPVFSLVLQAQEKPATATTPQPQLELQSPLEPKTTNSTILETPKEPLIKYSGLATDIKRSTNRWRMFSLRKPADPKTDGAHIIHETRTEGAKPVKIFSIDF